MQFTVRPSIKTTVIQCLAYAVLGFTQSATADFGPARVQSVTLYDEIANGFSHRCAFSENGRYLAFESTATNLTTANTLGLRQIQLLDRQTRSFELVSVSRHSATLGGDDNSSRPSLSNDGRYVVFESDANVLTADDNIGIRDVFSRDRTNATTTLLSKSADAFQTSYASTFPAISANGSTVAFLSLATNIIASQNDTAYFIDAFAGPISGGSRLLASIDTGGNLANSSSNYGWPALSGTGRFAAYGSLASDLVSTDTNNVADVFLYDQTAHSVELLSLDPNGTAFTYASRAVGPGSISADGNLVLFITEEQNAQLYQRNRALATTTLISASANGSSANSGVNSAMMSADGRFIVYQTEATNLLASAPHGGIFLYDRTLNTTTLLDTQGSLPCISADGQVVAYEKLESSSAAIQLFSREVDSCPTNPDKESPGTCGCNVIDSDRDRSGKFDCFEAWFRPKRPTVKLSGKQASVSFKRIKDLKKPQYRLYVAFGKKKAKVKTYKKSPVALTKLKTGKYTIYYTILKKVDGVTVSSLPSPVKKLTVK